MGAKPKGLVSRREVRKRLPEAYKRAALWVEDEAKNLPPDDARDTLYLALKEVVDFLGRKADQLHANAARFAGRRGG